MRHPEPRLLKRELVLLAASFASALACAAGPIAVNPIDDEPLEPEAAFPLSAPAAEPGHVELRFAIRDGYYLYSNRFRIEVEGLAAGPVRIPEGIEKDDAFVGKSRVLRGDVRLVLPLTQPPSKGEYPIRVTAQGCADQRVCYAPFTQVVRVRYP